MYVVKRDGRHDRVSFDKVVMRISQLCYGLDVDWVDPNRVAQKVIQGICSGIKTRELDELASETAAAMISTHPDYGKLAARIAVSTCTRRRRSNSLRSSPTCTSTCTP